MIAAALPELVCRFTWCCDQCPGEIAFSARVCVSCTGAVIAGDVELLTAQIGVCSAMLISCGAQIWTDAMPSQSDGPKGQIPPCAGAKTSADEAVAKACVARLPSPYAVSSQTSAVVTCMRDWAILVVMIVPQPQTARSDMRRPACARVRFYHLALALVRVGPGVIPEDSCCPGHTAAVLRVAL